LSDGPDRSFGPRGDETEDSTGQGGVVADGRGSSCPGQNAYIKEVLNPPILLGRDKPDGGE